MRLRPAHRRRVDTRRILFTDFVDTRRAALFDGPVTYDTIIRNGRWFDGTGAPSAVRNIGIRDGHVVAITADDLDDDRLPAGDRRRRASGCCPACSTSTPTTTSRCSTDPSLAESLRHGVTTVMLGSCSLSTIHVDGVDAGDIFGRVEAIPREHVIAAVDAAQDLVQR